MIFVLFLENVTDGMGPNRLETRVAAFQNISNTEKGRSFGTSQQTNTQNNKRHALSSENRTFSSNDPRLLALLTPGSSFTIEIMRRRSINGSPEEPPDDPGSDKSHTGLLTGPAGPEFIDFILQPHVERQSMEVNNSENSENPENENDEEEDIPEGDYLDEEDS